jgi:hypothetical protein
MEWNNKETRIYDEKTDYGIPSTPTPTKKTSMPILAGILLIISAMLIIAQSIYLVASAEDIVSLIDLEIYEEMNITITPEQIESYLSICGTVTIILSIFTLIGGITALKRKMLVLTILGGVFGIIAIAPLFMFIPNAISFIGLIIVVISRKEFQ